MKNKEYYKEELLDVLVEAMGVKKDTGEPFLCNGFGSCDKCLFKGKQYCNHQAREWLEQEEIKLSRTEKIILENVDKRFDCILRNKKGDLYLLNTTLSGISDEEIGQPSASYRRWDCYNHLFKFVTLEPFKACRIEELLENCEEV